MDYLNKLYKNQFNNVSDTHPDVINNNHDNMKYVNDDYYYDDAEENYINNTNNTNNTHSSHLGIISHIKKSKKNNSNYNNKDNSSNNNNVKEFINNKYKMEIFNYNTYGNSFNNIDSDNNNEKRENSKLYIIL